MENIITICGPVFWKPLGNTKAEIMDADENLSRLLNCCRDRLKEKKNEIISDILYDN